MITIRRAASDDAAAVAAMADKLLTEIMEVIGIKSFDSDQAALEEQLCDSLPNEKHYVLLAEREGAVVGFAALSAAYSLYTNGPFGLITELYVLPDHRSKSVGKRLVEECVVFAGSMGWSQLEVTTPPLPLFDRTLNFYEDNGFGITGGRKLKRVTKID